MAQQIISTNTFGVAKWIVSATASDGTHTTIATALTSSSSGDTIFIRPGTYTENLTLKAGVNLCAFECDSLTPNVTIVGKCTFTAAGTVTISGIRLQTNSDFVIAVTGSAASILNLQDCYLNCINNTGISFTSSSGSAQINCLNCNGDFGTTGITLIVSTSSGFATFTNCIFTNTGSTTTTSSSSSGAVTFDHCTLKTPFTTSSTGSIFILYCFVGLTNTTAVTTAGTASTNEIRWSTINSGTASAISVGSGTTSEIIGNRFDSSNTNVITGLGTLLLGLNTFAGSSSGINTTTITNENTGLTGTWTPNLQINGSNTGITYTTQAGGYTRIGNAVFIWCNIVLSSKGASSGGVTISNLPFSTGANGANQSISIGNVANIALPAGYTQSYLQLANSSAVGTISIAASGASALASGGISNTQIANNSSWQFTGVYLTN